MDRIRISYSTTPLWLPVALAWLLYRVGRCVLGALRLRKLALQYREPIFASVSAEDHEWVNQVFAELSPPIEAAGFVQEGDYHNKTVPYDTYNRYFLGFEGAVIGDISLIMGEAGASFFSVLADGTYVKTAGIDPMPGESPRHEDFLEVQYTGERPISQIIAIDVEFVRTVAHNRRSEILVFTPAEIPAASVFGHRRFSQWRQRLGEKTGDVSAAVLPSGTPTQAQVLDSAFSLSV